ncbi:MAG: acyloxyacyl hydrolase [Flavobacteriales bacterium]|nr:acyloxyacyl hydrolase [Flavobacteriales bacterium]
MAHDSKVYFFSSFFRPIGRNASLLVLLVILSVSALAQAPNSFRIGGNYGLVVPHRDDLKPLVTGNSVAITASAEWMVDGSKRWHYNYFRPRWGVELYAADLGNRAELGRQAALSLYTLLPIRRGQRFEHYLLTAGGIGFTDTTWDLEDNTKAIALGSPLNASVVLGLQSDYYLSDHWHIGASLRMTHLSNGAYTLPNLGINNLTVGLQVVYHINPIEPLPEGIWTSVLPRGRAHYAMLLTGVKENLPPGGPKFSVHTFSYAYEFRPSWKRGWSIRSDLFYNMAAAQLLGEERQSDALDMVQHGLALSYNQYLGRLRFDLMMGAYTFTRYKGNGTFYHRFSLRYDITEDWQCMIGLKTHWAKADYPEFGIGYRIF